MSDTPPAGCGQSAGRNGLQAPAAYSGEGQRPPREAKPFAVNGIAGEPMAGCSEIACSVLQPYRK